MPESKSNRVALYASAFVVIILLLFAMLRDNSDQITLNNARTILENHSVKSVVSSKEYIYLKTDSDLYKIASTQVTPEMFVDYKGL